MGGGGGGAKLRGIIHVWCQKCTVVNSLNNFQEHNLPREIDGLVHIYDNDNNSG